MTPETRRELLILLSDPTRFAILQVLAPRTFVQSAVVAEAVGIRSSVASHHLSLLAKGGLVIRTQMGRYAVYQLSRPALESLVLTLNLLLERTNHETNRPQTLPTQDNYLWEAGDREDGMEPDGPSDTGD